MKNALGAVRTVALFGGRSEIGLAILERLARDGAQEAVLAVRGGVVDESTVSRLKAAGLQRVECVDFDASDLDSHAASVERTFDRLGDVDVVVAAWGVLGEQAAYDADPPAAARDITVNFTSEVSVGLQVARRLRAQGHGTLVVLSSVAGYRVRRANLVYGAAKAGLDGFAQGLGDALAGSGASVMVVRPGYVHTTMSANVPPAPMSVQAADVGEAVARALATGREVVWVPSRLGLVMGLMRLLPRTAWRRLPR